MLIFIALFVYQYYGKDLLTPTIWLLFGYLISILFAITKFAEWGDLSLKVICVILLGVTSFIVGGFFANHVLVGKQFNMRNSYIVTNLKFNRISLFISLMFMLFTAYLNYNYVSRLAYSSGFTGGTNFMTYARNSLADGESMPYSIYIPIILSQMLAYLITYDFIRNIVYKNPNEKNYKLLKILCMAVFTLITILSSGRTMLMYYILFILFDVSVSLSVKGQWTKKYNRKIIKYGLISIITIFVAFTLIDVFLRSSQYGTQRNFADQIIKYTSSSLYALDNYIHNRTNAANGNYETMYNIYSLLNRFGFNFKIGVNYLEATNFANVSTNVYTALRRYIHDYGYFGMIIIQFIVGFFYQLVYKKIKKGCASLLTYIMYGTFIYAPVFNCIEERVMINVLSLRSVLMFIFTFVLIKLLRKEKNV